MKNLKYLRELHGFSQTQLGKLLKVSKNTILNWENGDRQPPFLAMSRLAQHLGFSLDDFAFKDMEVEEIRLVSDPKAPIEASEQSNYLVRVDDFATYCAANDARFYPKVIIPGIQGKARTFEVSNDSMAPLLMWGDWAICAPVEQAKGLEVGRIFVVVTQGSEVVLGYAQNFKEGVKVMPHNLAGHAWHMIPYDQVFEVWQVKMRLTKHFMLPYMVGDVGSAQANEPGSRQG